MFILSCIYEEKVVRSRPWKPLDKPTEQVTKPPQREDEVRSAGEAIILIVPESVQSVVLSGCGRQKKSVRHKQVRFFDVPKGTCSVGFSPSGLFTTIEGGVGIYRCNFLSNDSAVMCQASVE